MNISVAKHSKPTFTIPLLLSEPLRPERLTTLNPKHFVVAASPTKRLVESSNTSNMLKLSDPPTVNAENFGFGERFRKDSAIAQCTLAGGV